MDRICPLLALSGDRRSVVDGVDAAHRCHAEEPPAPLDRGMQAQLCLTPGHERCERYVGFIARSGVRTPGRSSVGDGVASTRLLLAPQPAWRGIAGRARGAPRAPLVAAGAGMLAVGVGAAAVAGGMLDLSGAAAPTASPATVRPTASADVTASPSPYPSPSASPTPSPTPSPTAAPTPPPTPVPTAPPPPPQQTYVVQEGDTLAAIAQQFGTTVEAIQAANGIEDPNSITVGQVLVIP
ncbi:MAG TPA: LysM domain-containing protein [Vitreimonas sp.]|nr:LysM domain-containing protein [Vitreimonas sp.]